MAQSASILFYFLLVISRAIDEVGVYKTEPVGQLRVATIANIAKDITPKR